MMKKGKCIYCKEVLKDDMNIRCDNCDIVWQDGYISGIKMMKRKLTEMFNALKNLSTD